ncbi:MAG: citrate lyase acyl carrier protein [candidate division KSB1 bacterium]|nr:citrate lyase acyl carrier protein [candidate division KSB1 bacterium]MDZ7386645.1 citrate lyase acyl carrier protein [candidate division KSB1 bacterium]MDZ7391509.1 citrate lyase acyl carrier protein [candidate division KSB1 bacterium]
MEKQVQVGRSDKSDLLLTLTMRRRGGIRIDLQSSVLGTFGEQIRRTVVGTLEQLGVRHAHVQVDDKGALDHVIMARVEAAVRALSPVAGPGVWPPRRAPRRQVAKDRLRRTRLYLPGNNPDLMLNAGLFGADSVILDLEDSVAPQDKGAARILVRNTLLAVDFGAAERIVRINPLATEFGALDLEVVVPAEPDTILIPKCEAASSVVEVEERVAALERQHRLRRNIWLMPLIETARGVLNAYEIATASQRVVALCFGAEDFSADIGAERTVEGKESFVARSLLVLAAKAARVQALDTVFSDVADVEGLVKSTEEAIALGFEGKGVIHPAQIEPIHRAFAPSPERIAHAQQVIAALEEAERRGAGVASLGTKMIDAPVVARARRTLQLAKALGLVE